LPAALKNRHPTPAVSNEFDASETGHSVIQTSTERLPSSQDVTTSSSAANVTGSSLSHIPSATDSRTSVSSFQTTGIASPSTESYSTSQTSRLTSNNPSLTTSTIEQSETGAASSLTSSTTDSSTEALALITYSRYPSIRTEEIPSITTDRHIESTGSDHRATRVPVLNPHFYFCPAGLKVGLSLFGLLPGIYLPGPPPLPGFKIPFPRITIGNNGDPTYSSPEPTHQDSTSSGAEASTSGASSSTETTLSSSCTITTTASICSQFLSYDVDQAGSTTATHPSTFCSSTIGCTVLNNFATSTTTSISSCPTFRRLISDYVWNHNEDENSENLPRALEEVPNTTSQQGLRTRFLVKRAAPTWDPASKLITSAVNCVLKPASLISTPKGKLMNTLNPPAVHWYITERTSGGCGVWRPALVTDPVKNGFRDASGRLYSYAVDPPQQE
jgi:hypothetical protein